MRRKPEIGALLERQRIGDHLDPGDRAETLAAGELALTRILGAGRAPGRRQGRILMTLTALVAVVALATTWHLQQRHRTDAPTKPVAVDALLSGRRGNAGQLKGHDPLPTLADLIHAYDRAVPSQIAEGMGNWTDSGECRVDEPECVLRDVGSQSVWYTPSELHMTSQMWRLMANQGGIVTLGKVRYHGRTFATLSSNTPENHVQTILLVDPANGVLAKELSVRVRPGHRPLWIKAP